MKRALLAAMFSVAAPSLVLAADLGYYGKAPPPAGFDWSGLYIGGHIGGGWAKNDLTDPGSTLSSTAYANFQTTDSSGFLGGVQGGWNYQIGRFVIGTDADFSWSSIDGSSTFGYDNSTRSSAFRNQTLSADTNWTGTATTRLGVAASNWLLYSKIGVAWAHTDYTENNSHIHSSGTVFDEFDGVGGKTLTGWTVGTGVEWAFFTSWTARLEYDFLDFGNNPISINGTRDPGQSYSRTQSFPIYNNQTISEVKFGLSYKLPPGLLGFF